MLKLYCIEYVRPWQYIVFGPAPYKVQTVILSRISCVWGNSRAAFSERQCTSVDTTKVASSLSFPIRQSLSSLCCDWLHLFNALCLNVGFVHYILRPQARVYTGIISLTLPHLNQKIRKLSALRGFSPQLFITCFFVKFLPYRAQGHDECNPRFNCFWHDGTSVHGCHVFTQFLVNLW